MFIGWYQSSQNKGPSQGTSAGWRRWRRLWRGWIVIPTGIGVSVFTVWQWRRLNWSNQSQQENINITKNFRITCYRAIPLRAMSRAWGWLSSQQIPLNFRYWLYTRYSNMYGVNLEEAAYSLDQYDSLCEFFVRPLKDGVRPINEYEPIVSPADGSIINVGVVRSCNVEQIKGVTYTIKTFLGEPTWNDRMVTYDDETTTSVSGPNLSNSSSHENGGVKTAKIYKFEGDNVMDKLRGNEGCELLHLDIDDSCGGCSRRGGKMVDSRVLGWLVFYFQFCIKDLLINSFYFGFQIIYGIKTSIVVSNGKILQGASFLRSQLSFSSGSAPAHDLAYDTDGNDSADEDENAYCNADWNNYKKKLLHNQDNELYQFIVYLAPGDYHRFHSPADLKIKFRRHFQGELFSVHPKVAEWIPELFSLNERAVYVGEWQHGFFSMVAVGATNVGSIKVHADEELLTNTRRRRNSPRFNDKVLNTCWKKGEEVGLFRLGSTIVLLFEAPKNYLFSVDSGQRIKVGEAVTNSNATFDGKVS